MKDEKINMKIIKKRMWDYLRKYKLISPVQFGFQSLLGTHDAIFDFLDGVYSELNRGEAVAAVFCDLAKAFDCVDRSILLSKLEHYGFRGHAIAWFSSYLGNRKQSVKVSDRKSSALPTDYGVPQGSVLGPLLFLIYINDLTKIEISGKFTLFADDTSIVWHAGSHIALKETITKDFGKIRDWCNSNKLSLNISKTSIVGFRCEMQGVHTGENPLQEQPFAKFLGVLIDGELRFEEHILTLSKKLSSACFAVRTAREELGPEIARTVYFALFESHLRYGIPFWGVTSQYLLQMIFVLQKKAVRFIYNKNQRESCRPLFKNERILTLTSLFILETCTLIYKTRSSVQGSTTRRETRQAHDLPLPIPTKELTKKSIIYEGKKIFNYLPLHVKTIDSLKFFRRSVKEMLFAKAYYTLEEYYTDPPM